MREDQTISIKVNGSFYLGDLCYCLRDEVYYGVWGQKYNWEDGGYTDPETNLQFGMVSTAYGDGCYPSSKGFCFPVDAGIIGVCDMGLSKKSREDLDRDCGLVFDYTGTVYLSYEDGTISAEFGGTCITIETDDWFEEDDEEDYEDEEVDEDDYFDTDFDVDEDDEEEY